MKEKLFAAAQTIRRIAGIATLTFLVCVGGFLAYGTFRGDSNIRVSCSVGRNHRCQFTNTGSGSGTACVVIVLRHRTTGASIESQPTCSGSVAAGDTTEREVMFIGPARPILHCSGNIRSACDMEIAFVGATGRPVSAPPPPSPQPNLAPSGAASASTDCGLVLGGGDALGNQRDSTWQRWRCKTERKALDFDACLQRRQYSPLSSRGCPGDQRCCPPRRSSPENVVR